METPKVPNHSHAWRGTWDRPMLIDEDALDPFTVARMTDHNVKGRDREPIKTDRTSQLTNNWENEGGPPDRESFSSHTRKNIR